MTEDFEERIKEWCATKHPTIILDSIVDMLIHLKEDWEDDQLHRDTWQDSEWDDDEYKELRKLLIRNTKNALTLMEECVKAGGVKPVGDLNE
jgi:alpha-amylase/alpha-mannosidase (GH57 family)|tara:strand:+ start:309 stop:584 length:276 start_codon:yes stop_codon:yes gene_type:complete